MSRRNFRPTLDVLEAKIALSDSPIPAPVGITTPIEPAPSPTDLDQASELVVPILVGSGDALPAPLPPLAVPTSPVVLGSYGGPVPVQLPNVLVAVPRPLYGPLGPVHYT